MGNHETNWGAEAWREPSIPADAEPVFSECGRVIGNVTYRSHWFRVTREAYQGAYRLYVKHGAGEESFSLGYSSTAKTTVDALAGMGSDARYLALHLLYRVHTEARYAQRDETAKLYMTAFVEGRLKKRKVRGQGAYRVEIQQPVRAAVSA